MENVFLIVGLGNPGEKYARTRHNAGFLLVEKAAERWRANWGLEKKFSAKLAKVERNGRKLFFCEPQTYMNVSGEAVGALSEFFRIPASNILIAVDDADLPFGQIRLRKSGSSGGHHGLDSIEHHLATREFARLRVGIGRQDGVREITNYVLGQFSSTENELLEKVLERAADQIECWLGEGIEKAMSKFNGVIDSENKEK
ncbi:MAG: pth [Verrucomicrobiales bacterium]|nr:pth [Verrucomicrobiales bacterium]